VRSGAISLTIWTVSGIHTNLEATQYSADPDLEIPLHKRDEAMIAIALVQPET
jgi:hypothetical protein